MGIDIQTKVPGIGIISHESLSTIKTRSPNHCYPLPKRQDSKLNHSQNLSVECKCVRVFILDGGKPSSRRGQLINVGVSLDTTGLSLLEKPDLWCSAITK